MNNRQYKKELRKPLGYKTYIHCYDWKFTCAKDREYSCKGCCDFYIFSTKKAFVALLRNEGFSTSGWRLAEIPAKGVYIFYNHKKKKEITLETGDYKSYAITVYDFHSCTNVEYKTMTEALHSPLHTYFYAPGFHKNSFRKERKKRLTANFCGE